MDGGTDDAGTHIASIDATATVVDGTPADAPYTPSALDEAIASGAVHGTKVGRYVLLEELGRGAMGFVFMAYDANLARAVAIKLLRPALTAKSWGTQGQARLLREAQAAAQLDHPNVVTIYEADVDRGVAYIAMEYVRGQTLGTWARGDRPRPWPEVVEVFTQAGRGLAAAHKVDILHRDFKPDNVLLDEEGTAKVTDFGIAVLAGGELSSASVDVDEQLQEVSGTSSKLDVRLTRPGSVMGTPAYMAPEQHRDETLDHRADLYGYCVALYEALYGVRPFAGDTVKALYHAKRKQQFVKPVTGARVPRWLDAIVRSGLATEPDDRPRSMDELLEALTRGQSRQRSRWVVAGITVAGLSIAGLVGAVQLDHVRRARRCEAAGNRIDDTWNDATRQRVRNGLLAADMKYAPQAVDKSMVRLDAFAEGWRAKRVETCRAATVERSLDDSLAARADHCLEGRRIRFEALTKGLSKPADRYVLFGAVRAAAGLPRVDPCGEIPYLAAQPTIAPEDADGDRALQELLALATTDRALGRDDDAIDGAERALVLAKSLSEAQTAVAHLELGLAADNIGDKERAERELTAAYESAPRDEVAALAAIELVGIVGYDQSRHAEGIVWASAAKTALREVEPEPGLRTALLKNYLELVLYEKREFDRARKLQQEALAIRESILGPDHPTVGVSLNNLANIMSNEGDNDGAEALHRRVLSIAEEALGPDHPHVATSLGNLAGILDRRGEHEEAMALQLRSLAVFEESLGEEHPEVARTLNNLAEMHEGHGDLEKAQALYERALAILEKTIGHDHPNVARVLTNLAALHHKQERWAESKALHERALGIREEALGADHPFVADSLGSLAKVALATDDPAGALPLAERALEIMESGEEPPNRVAHKRFLLAQVLWASEKDLVRAQREAQTAAEALRHATDDEEALTEIQAWLESHAVPD